MTNHTNDFFSVTRNRPSTCFFAREMSNGRFVRDETIDLSPANFFSFASVSNRNRGNKNTWKFIIVDNDTKILSLPTAPQLFPIPPLTSDRRKIHPTFFSIRYYFFPRIPIFFRKRKRILFSIIIIIPFSEDNNLLSRISLSPEFRLKIFDIFSG